MLLKINEDDQRVKKGNGACLLGGTFALARSSPPAEKARIEGKGYAPAGLDSNSWMRLLIASRSFLMASASPLSI